MKVWKRIKTGYKGTLFKLQAGNPTCFSIPADSYLVAHAQADANDLLFTSSDGTTKLSHEIEKQVGGKE